MINDLVKSIPFSVWAAAIGWLATSVMWLLSLENRISDNARAVTKLQTEMQQLDKTALGVRVQHLEERTDKIIQRMVPP